MFNVGGPEIVVILLVALVVLGPDQLPKAMRTMGNVMAEVRKVSNGFQSEMRKAMDTIETSATPSGRATSARPRQSPPVTPSVGPGATEPPGTDPAVTEVVARNPGPDPEPPSVAPDATAPTDAAAPPAPPAVAEERPPIDPADRAAG